MSCGFDEPSISASPARTRSPSCTLMCLPFGIRYSFGSPPVVRRHDHAALAARRRGRTTTVPSISRDDRELLRLAGLEELRDARQTARDVLGLAWSRAGSSRARRPAATSSPSVDREVGADRQQRCARSSCRPRPSTEMRGRSSGSFDSMITFDESPVNSSTCSCIVTPSMMSPNFTVPADLGEDRVGERIPLEQHVARLHVLRRPRRARARRTRPGSARARGR